MLRTTLVQTCICTLGILLFAPRSAAAPPLMALVDASSNYWTPGGVPSSRVLFVHLDHLHIFGVYPTISVTYVEARPGSNTYLFAFRSNARGRPGKNWLIEYDPVEGVVRSHTHERDIAIRHGPDHPHMFNHPIRFGDKDHLWLMTEAVGQEKWQQTVELLRWADNGITVISRYPLPDDLVGRTNMVPVGEQCVLLSLTDGVVPTTAVLLDASGETTPLDLQLDVGDALEAVQVENGVLWGMTRSTGVFVSVPLEGVEKKAQTFPLLDPRSPKMVVSYEHIGNESVIGLGERGRITEMVFVDRPNATISRTVTLEEPVPMLHYFAGHFYGVSNEAGRVFRFDMDGKIIAESKPLVSIRGTATTGR